MHQLFISLIIIEGDDWDAIVQLVPEGIDCVIYYYEVVKVTVRNNSQVFNVNALFSSDAMITVKSVLDQLIGRIENV